jgi:hypothetical protein
MKKGLMIAFAAVLLAGCAAAVPVPADKQDYIGDWRGKTSSLSIAPNGYVSYERQDGNISESVSGPITKFESRGFTVNALIVTREFKVESAPVRGNGVWKMTVNGEALEKADNDAARTLPDEKTLIALVNDSFVVFGVSVYRKDFGYFYNNISRVWQEQTTAAEIQAAFQAFIDNDINLRNVTKRNPTFTEQPKIDADGALVIKGRYPTEPATHFELKYVYEHPAWKLIEFGCRIK